MDHPERIAVCTATFYPKWYPGSADVRQLVNGGDRALAESKVRGDIALETFRTTLRKGYRLALVDGARGSAFREALASGGIPFEEEKRKGMSPSRVQSYDIAFAQRAVEAVSWLEPEKEKMVEELEACAEPILTDDAAVVVPARTDAGWDTLPAYQRDSERKANRVYSDKLRRAGLWKEEDLDVYFGPRIWSARGLYRDRIQDILRRTYEFHANRSIPLHAAVNPGSYSEATFFPVVAALHEGLPVRSVPTRFTYPPPQRILEEFEAFAGGNNGYRAKRDTQQIGILTEHVNYLRSLGLLPGIARLEERQ